MTEDTYFLWARSMSPILIARQYWTIVSGVDIMKAVFRKDAQLAHVHRFQCTVSTITMTVMAAIVMIGTFLCSDLCLASTTDTEYRAVLWQEVRAKYHICTESTIFSFFTDFHLVSMQKEESVNSAQIRLDL